jgi:hypothetical protein
MLPVDEVSIELLKCMISDWARVFIIYTKQQLDKFAAFQDSQGSRKAYLAELAYIGQNKKGEWGLALGA